MAVAEVVHEDGTVDQLTVLPGMTWAMVFADGTPAGGTIFLQGGKNCFVTEGEPGHQCFEGSEPDENGAMKVTAEDGEVVTGPRRNRSTRDRLRKHRRLAPA